MSHFSATIRQLVAALRGWVIFTVICGLAYPLVVFGIAQLAFPGQANGSLVTYHGRVIGSSLLCQEFTSAKGQPLPQYFQPRPSASAVSATSGTGGCNPLASGASNLGPNNPVLVRDIHARQRQIAGFDHVPVAAIPPDAVTTSGSGLDPYISPRNAAIQAGRVAAARHIGRAAVMALVRRYTQGRVIGILGEPRVNVLLLNIALDERYPVR
ncbi:MAG: potassium-transporting ATPase subunit KdpC [Streptosporangiaceae bacterium]